MHTHPHHCTHHCHPRPDPSTELAKALGSVAGVIVKNLITQHQPVAAVKARYLTWRQFRGMRTTHYTPM
jgi:hypothetical protein